VAGDRQAGEGISPAFVQEALDANAVADRLLNPGKSIIAIRQDMMNPFIASTS
jgi:hypothetical protein